LVLSGGAGEKLIAAQESAEHQAVRVALCISAACFIYASNK